MKILGIDVGGTEIKFGLIDEHFNLTNKDHILTPKVDTEGFINTIFEIYSRFDNIEAIVLSVPGFVDHEKGIHKGAGAIKYLCGQNVCELVKEKCHVDCFMDNDAKAATVAEYHLGSLKDTTNSAVFLIGTGVGGGLIIDKKLHRGYDNTAGEFSYMNVDIHKDNMEDASMSYNCCTPELLRMYNRYSNSDEQIDGREFFKRYENGDQNAHLALDDFCKNVAKQIQNIAILLNVERIAIGGGISASDILIDKIKEVMNNLEFNDYFKTINYNPFIPEIVRCKFKNDANIIGVTYEYLERLGYNLPK